MFRDGFFPDGIEQQARFAWTEEDGNIASLVSEPGFGTTGQTTFGKQIDSALKSELKVYTLVIFFASIFHLVLSCFELIRYHRFSLSVLYVYKVDHVSVDE